MIKKLKRRFVLISLLSVFIVLLVTFFSIDIFNHVALENDAKSALAEVIRRGTEDIMNDKPQEGEMRNRVELREVHYFVVSFDQQGEVKAYNTRHMFILSQDECLNLAKRVNQGELTNGRYETFRYTLASKDDGLNYVGFIDIKEKLDSASQYRLISSLIALGAFLAFFVLVVLGSNIVFKSSEDAYRKQKRFITNASHELKTPLTVISADLDLLTPSQENDEWISSIRDQVSRLVKMTNQLVTLAKLDEEDKTRFPMEDFSINQVCHEAIDAFAPGFKKEGIKFSSHITGNLTMFGNRHLMEELVYLFLDNSLKYTGGENKSSYFVVNENKKNIEFRFSNTIDKDDEVDIKQIMERFYRSPSQKKEGSGVGLSIAKEIIDFHKGKIKIEKNENTLFFIISFHR